MLFKNGDIFIDGAFARGGFRVDNGRFSEVFLGDTDEPGVELGGKCVIPGLIDIHTHGNSNEDFSDGSYDGLVKLAEYLALNGITSFAPASMTLPYERLEVAYRNAARLHRERPAGCARLEGINMEGPFFSEKKKGAQNA